MAGSIQHRGKDKYKLSYMYKSQRYYRTVVAASEKEAKKLLKIFISNVKQISLINPKVCTLTEFVKIYLKNYAKDYLAVECVYNYQHALEYWVLPKIRKSDFRAMYN